MPTAEPVIIPLIYTENVSGLVRSVEQLEKVRVATEEMKAAQQKAFTESAQSVSGYANSLQKAAAENEDFAATTKDANRENTVLSATLKDNVRNLNLFGFNVGAVIDQFRSKQAALRGVVTGLQNTTGALRILKVALISTGIGAIVVALGSLIALLTKSEKGMEFVERAASALGAALDVVVDRAVLLGGALVKFFSGDVKGAIEDTKNAFTGVTNEIIKEASAAYLLEQATQDLEDRNRNLRLEYAKQRAEIEKLREVAADETNSFAERSKAAQDAIKIENKLESDRIAAAKEKLRIVQEENKLRKGNITDELTEKEIEAQIELEEISAESSRRRRRDQKFFQALQRQQAALARQAAEEERKLNEGRIKAFSEIQKELEKRIQAEELLALDSEERLKEQQRISQRELDLLRQSALEKAKAVKASNETLTELDAEFANLSLLLENRFQKELADLREKNRIEREGAERKAREAKIARDDKEIQDGFAKIEQEKKIADAEIELLEANADDVLTLEQRKEAERLKIQREAFIQQRSLLAARFGNDSPEVQLLDLQIKAITRKIEDYENISVNPVKALKDNILKALKIDEKEFDEFSKGFTFVAEQALNALNEFSKARIAAVEAEIAAQDRVIAKFDERIAKQEETLSIEEQRAEEGVANNLDLERENLKALEAERQAAEERQEQNRLRLEKIKINAEKRQAVANAAAQISNLALAASELLAAHASIPLVGIGLALGFIGTMVAAFSAFKKKAKGLAQLREGGNLGEMFSGEVKGESHERGGVPAHLRKQGKTIELEGREFVMPVKQTQEHGEFLEDMRMGEFSGLDLNKHIDFARAFNADPPGMITDLAPKYGIPVLPDVIGGMLPGIRKSVEKGIAAKTAAEQALLAGALADYLGRVEGGMSRVEKAIKEQPLAVPITEEGYLLIQQKGNTKSTNIYDKPKRKSKP